MMSTFAQTVATVSVEKSLKPESPPDSCATLASSQTSYEEDGNDCKAHQLADTDYEVHRLQQSGDLQQVVGSQSMLSQELLRPSQIDYESGDEDVVEDARSSFLNNSRSASVHWLKSALENHAPQAKHDDRREKSYGGTSKDDIASVLLSLPNSQPDDNHDEGTMMGLDAMKHAASNHLFMSKRTKTTQDRRGTENLQTIVSDTNDEYKPLSQTSLGSLLDAIQIINEQGDQSVAENLGSESQAGGTGLSNDRPKRRRVAPKDKHLESSTLPIKSSKKKLKANDCRKLQLPMTAKKRSSPTKASPVPSSSASTSKSRLEVAKYVFPQGRPDVLQPADEASSKMISRPPSSSCAVVHVHDAAELATKIIHDHELAKELLLSMALCRTNPRTPPESIPGHGHVLTDGFFWSRYPPLEAVLKDYMPEYYRLSIEKCQSCQQQSFNNRLVVEVTATANVLGWKFDPEHFTDVKVLRDRIRCYYKTHIQNAKKRLKTMLRNPTKKSNAIHLKEHYDLIQQAAQKKLEADEEHAAWLRKHVTSR